MSKFSDAYDAIKGQLIDLFPGKTYIPNPYSLEDNIDRFLLNGVGLRVDEESDVNSQFNFFTSSHAFTVIFTRELKRLESDVDPVHEVVKLLKEDVFSLKKEFYDSGNITLPADIDLINFGATSGVTTFLVGNNSFLSIESTLLVVIREQATNC